MTRTVFEHHTLAQCVREVYAERAGACSLVLCSSMAEADSLKKTLAHDPCFQTRGLTIAPFASYLTDQWELKGDGRVPISALERFCAVFSLLHTCDLGFAISVGCAKELATFVSECALLPAGFASLREQRNLTDSQTKLVDFALQYHKLMGERYLVEPAEAARILAARETRDCVLRVSAAPQAYHRAFVEHYPQDLHIALVGSGIANAQLNELALWEEVLGTGGFSFERAEVPAANTPPELAPALQALRERLFAPDEANPLIPQGEIEIDLPAGRYAQASLMAERLRPSLEAHKSCVVCTNKPGELFYQLQQFLPCQSVEFIESKYFSETASGQVFLNLSYLLLDGEVPADANCLACDLLLSDPSSLSLSQAFARAAHILSDRLMTAKRALDMVAPDLAGADDTPKEEVREAQDVVEQVYQALRNHDPLGALDCLRAYYEPRQFYPQTGLFASLEVRAIKSAQAIVEQAKRYKLPKQALLDILVATQVSLGARTVGEHQSPDQESGEDMKIQSGILVDDQVTSTDPEKFFGYGALGLGLTDDPNAIDELQAFVACPRSVQEQTALLRIESMRCFMQSQEPTQVLMVADLNSSDVSLIKKPFIHQDLFAAYGVSLVQDKTLAARCGFIGALELTTEKLHLVRCMNNTDADPENPSVLFDDVVDCYRSNLRSDKELIRSSQLPPCLHEQAYQRGEDALAANLSPRTSELAVDLNVEHSDTLDAFELALVKHEPYQGKAFDKPLRFSASAIEAYLACPKSWFYSRHIKTSECGEDFGAREKGSFAHAVLQQFFEQAPELIGQVRVTPDNVERAVQVLRQIAQKEAARQFELRPGERLVPINPLEEEERELLIEGLVRFIEAQQHFAPGFAPAHLEWAFGFDKEVRYANLPLCGRIDRIDVDAQGNALIIDYKSQKNFKADDYAVTAAEFADFKLPPKIQTLIYAQIIRRELGLKLRGALYLSVTKDAGTGVVDGRFIGTPELGGYKELCAISTGFESFDFALDLIEAKIEERMRALTERGFIGMEPVSDASCTYCMVKDSCTERKDS